VKLPESGKAEFYLATVKRWNSTTKEANIQLDGQDSMSSKSYKTICGAVSVNKRVVVMKHSGTFVILGVIGGSGNAGEDGRGIVSIDKTATQGLVDTYTISYTDGTTSTYTVSNGAKGPKGDAYELTQEDINEIATIAATQVQFNILNSVYPVGSIYMSLNSTSPATLFGGTWQRITGRFLLAASDTDGGANTAQRPVNATGGSANAIVPYHRHTAYSYVADKAASGNAIPRLYGASYSSADGVQYTTYAGTAGNTAGANMPPYVAVYVWQRTE